MTKREAELVLDRPEEARRLAQKVLARSQEAKAARRRSRALPRHPAAKQANERKAAKREERIASLASLRAAVFAISGGKCAVCDEMLPAVWHLHHARGGGERRRVESASNCAPLCEACHRDVHRGDPETLDSLHNYFIVYHLTDGAFAVGRRLAKIEEARAAQHPAKETDHG